MAMSKEHKEALARGRKEGRAIKAYLEAIGSRRPGRPVTAETLRKRIAGLEEKIAAEADPLKRVDLVQARLDAEDQLARTEEVVDLEAVEADFVAMAMAYSERKGISYSAWREAGVPAPVLKQAGIARTRRA
jgi:hypothetical protein